MRSEAISIENKTLGKPVVLIVEDEPEIAEIIRINLEARGMEVHWADTGLKACSLVAIKHPDAIILDLMLPDIDGREICRLIRRHDDASVAQTPVLMLTALGDVNHREIGLEAGADDYMGKPFSVKELCLRVDTLVQKNIFRKDSEAKIGRLKMDSEEARMREGVLLHEIANKLVAIGGFSKRLEMRANSLCEDEIRALARDISRSAAYLESAASGVRALKEIEDTCTSYKCLCDLREGASDAIALHRGHADKKGILIFEEINEECVSASLPAEIARLIVSNLIENAVNYCPVMSTIVVRTLYSGGSAVIEVEDDGPGIGEEDQRHIFDYRYRGKNSGGIPGSGMGLYIVRASAGRFGGKVEIISGDGRAGVLVRVSFPKTAESGGGADSVVIV